MNTAGNAWPQERVKRFIEMWTEGAAFSLIAAELGVSRNAAIGKAQRLGLKRSQGKSVGPCKRPPPRLGILRMDKEPLKNIQLVEPAPSLVPSPKSLMELQFGDCRWPIGEFFCGAPAGKQTYCPYHTRRSLKRWEYEERKRDEGSQASREKGSPEAKAAA